MSDFENWDFVKNPATTISTGAPPIVIAANITTNGTTPEISVALGQEYNVYGHGSFAAAPAVVVTVEWSADPVGEVWIVGVSGVATNLRAGAFKDTLNVLVGNAGEILTSLDGSTWVSQTSGTANNLRDVFIGVDPGMADVYVAVGISGTITTSPDGITWTVRVSGTTSSLQGGVFANALFVVCGSMGTILTSLDGITWVTQTSGVTENLQKIAFGNGLFIAVGDNGTIITSSDAITWTSQNSPITTSDLQDIIYSGDLFLAVANSSVAPNIIISTDGFFWEPAGVGLPGSVLHSAAFISNTYLIGASNGEVFTSVNVSGWELQTVGNMSTVFTLWQNIDRIHAAGGSGMVYTNIRTWIILQDVNGADVQFSATNVFNIPRIGAEVFLRTDTIDSGATSDVTVDLR